MATRATRAKPFASLGASLLGRSGPRRAPLILAGAPEAGANEAPQPLPEIVLQVQRLIEVYPVEAPEPAPSAEPEAAKLARRIAFTLRLDRDRHGALRQAVLDEGRSGQAIVTAALDRYLAANTVLHRSGKLS